MDLLKKRIARIKTTLWRHDPDLAASLLINTMASDAMFKYWAGCCQDSERVPKILKFIRHIAFDPGVPTAAVNFMKGELRIGMQFFLDHINGPEDFLFILIHERNHLILRKLYPHVISDDYPRHLFNFGEDAFINAVSRRHVPSTLPERFYKRPVEMILTGKHSCIDWDHFKTDDNGINRLKDAHADIYKFNFNLLRAIRESSLYSANSCGYEQWMRLVLDWHKWIQENPPKTYESGRQLDSDNYETSKSETDIEVVKANGTDEAKTESDKDPETVPSKEDETEDQDQQNKDEDGKASEQEVPESASNDDPNGQEDVGDDGTGHINDDTEDTDQVDRTQEENPVQANDDNDADDSEQDQDPQNGKGEQTDNGIDSVLKDIVPLVQDESKMSVGGNQVGASERGDKMLKIPLPDLKPNDPVVQLILQTCDINEFRRSVIIFEGDILEHVEGLINGILSDRATERSYDGYSVSVPLSVTRRDVFALSSGAIPVMWQRRVGIERPYIDLYVDVSGSMGRYYGYIPFIYRALKHVMGRVFQFSTKVVEVDHHERYLHTSGGTTFDSVAKHMINEQTRCAIILSDGMSQISPTHMDALKHQIEHLVYIKIKENEYKNWEHLATDIIYLLKKEAS